MAPEDRTDEKPPKVELAENEDVKEEEVLDREGVEQELMQTDRSDVGEEIEGVEDE